ncbi:hypothetical protein [Microlunatus speluncae]|uniref:hypothetical protein n=1 Tax=Microlunatus speluncae TaxID=2594267 RepID=UPI001266501C|nr:hypothetical protein [Microlunatus speluncae]
MSAERAVKGLRAVLPRTASFSTVTEPSPGSARDWRPDALVSVAGQTIAVEWLRAGTLPAVTNVLNRSPRPYVTVIVAPKMSEGARAAAAKAGVGWVEETGAAEISLPFLIVSRTAPPQLASKQVRWRASDLGVAEALLEGVRPTVDEVTKATGMSSSTVTASLAFLAAEGQLEADAARGRKSARSLSDPGALLDSYASAAGAFAPKAEIHVGLLARDPLAAIAEIGESWRKQKVTWAATSAVAAAALAPFATQVAPLLVYIDADTHPQLVAGAELVNLSPIRGGRLALRPFPTKATAKLSEWRDGLAIVPWARCYADLMTTGVRGEDIATNLRELMLNE